MESLDLTNFKSVFVSLLFQKGMNLEIPTKIMATMETFAIYFKHTSYPLELMVKHRPLALDVGNKGRVLIRFIVDKL